MNITINFLLVDDVEYSRELLRTALLTCMREHKIDIRSNFFHSSTGKLIVEQITENKIDVVYLDIELSNISGLELLTEIRQAKPELSVVMVSGESSSANVTKAIKAGANGFIVKPFNYGRVLDSLHKFLEKEHNQ